jgi:hypothetical protein
VLGRELQREEGTLGVDGVEAVEVVLGDVDRGCLDQFDAGVGDDDVEAAEVLDCFGEQSMALPPDRSIASTASAAVVSDDE